MGPKTFLSTSPPQQNLLFILLAKYVKAIYLINDLLYIFIDSRYVFFFFEDDTPNSLALFFIVYCGLLSLDCDKIFCLTKLHSGSWIFSRPIHALPCKV